MMKRSNPQNARYWALLHMIAAQITPNGTHYSPQTWHYYVKSRFLGCDDVILPNSKVLVIPRSTTTLDVREFNEYMEQVEAWAAERGVYLADMENAA